MKNVLSTAKVTVILGREVYVAPTQSIREICRLEVEIRSKNGQPKFTKWVLRCKADISTFENWKITGGLNDCLAMTWADTRERG